MTQDKRNSTDFHFDFNFFNKLLNFNLDNDYKKYYLFTNIKLSILIMSKKKCQKIYLTNREKEMDTLNY